VTDLDTGQMAIETGQMESCVPIFHRFINASSQVICTHSQIKQSISRKVTIMEHMDATQKRYLDAVSIAFKNIILCKSVIPRNRNKFPI